MEVDGRRRAHGVSQYRRGALTPERRACRRCPFRANIALLARTLPGASCAYGSPVSAHSQLPRAAGRRSRASRRAGPAPTSGASCGRRVLAAEALVGLGQHLVGAAGAARRVDRAVVAARLAHHDRLRDREVAEPLPTVCPAFPPWPVAAWRARTCAVQPDIRERRAASDACWAARAALKRRPHAPRRPRGSGRPRRGPSEIRTTSAPARPRSCAHALEPRRARRRAAPRRGCTSARVGRR